MCTFEAMLNDISRRPALYVGKMCLHSVSHYLYGYDHALSDLSAEERPLKGWMEWVALRYLIWDTAWGWPRILLHIYKTDAEAIAALPGLYQEFQIQRAAIGVSGIEAELKRQLLAAYGEEWYAPDVLAGDLQPLGLP